MMATPGESRLLRIFPLPEVVLLPETHLPLHVFEPRYRALLADALGSDRLVGIQTLRPGQRTDAEGRPEVLEIGCAGEVVEHEPLGDGRSNVILKGVFRYRMEGERSGGVYRVAQVRVLPALFLPESRPASPSRRDLRRLLAHSVDRLAVSVGRPEARRLPRGLSDEGLANEAASRLGLGPEDRYRLLAMDRLEDRYHWILGHVTELQQRLELLAPYRRPPDDARWN